MVKVCPLSQSQRTFGTCQSGRERVRWVGVVNPKVRLLNPEPCKCISDTHHKDHLNPSLSKSYSRIKLFHFLFIELDTYQQGGLLSIRSVGFSMACAHTHVTVTQAHIWNIPSLQIPSSPSRQSHPLPQQGILLLPLSIHRGFWNYP